MNNLLILINLSFDKMQNGTKKKESYYFIPCYLPNENNEKKVKILDKHFIKTNRKNCKIVYKNKIYELKEYFEDIDANYNHKDLIKFKLIFINNKIDMSYMFYECDSLYSLTDNNKKNLKISYMKFYVTNMHNFFDGCKSLTLLPDISVWDTSYTFCMGSMFSECESLKSLPDISKWNISNVKHMNFMFYKCNEKNVCFMQFIKFIT